MPGNAKTMKGIDVDPIIFTKVDTFFRNIAAKIFKLNSKMPIILYLFGGIVIYSI
jgi:hypothetical protein